MPERVAIVGVGESRYGKVPDGTPLTFHAEAARAAVADAGLTKAHIDGLMSTGGSYGMMPTVALAEYLGLQPKVIDGTNTGGGAFETMVEHAVAVLQAGQCEYVLIAYGAQPRSMAGHRMGVRFSQPGTPVAYDDPFGLPLPARAALAASRHMHLYGTKPEQLAEVAVSIRRNASRNPKAMYQDPITIDDVLNSRMIADPLHMLDCCVVSDGGGALVLTLESRARDLATQPVWVLGTGTAVGAETIGGWPEFGRMVSQESGAIAFAQAGLGPQDIDVLQLYDAFTINVLLQLETLGFCAPGEAGALVEGGTLCWDGALPTNTDGGGLSSNHPGMRGIFLLIEAVRQLRGESTAQVPDAEVALCNGTGGPFSASGTVILGKDR